MALFVSRLCTYTAWYRALMASLNTRPIASECSIRPDYSYDSAVCLMIPRSESPLSTGTTTYTSASVGPGCGLTSASTQASNLGSASASTTAAPLQPGFPLFCRPMPPVTFSVWQRWSTTTETSGSSTMTYEKLGIPQGLEKCVPGSTQCLHRYRGTGCPNGHTLMNLAVESSRSKFICCPS